MLARLALAVGPTGESARMSRTTLRSSPKISPSDSASPTAAIAAPKAAFVTIFAAAPAPGPPTWCTVPSGSKISRTRSNPSSVAPTKMSSLPPLASGALPRTGESTTITPSGTRSRTERISSGPTVDMSISTCPGPSARARPPSNTTSSRTWGLASMVMTTSNPAAASAGEVATECLPGEVRALSPPVVAGEPRLGCHRSGEQPVCHRPVNEHADVVIHGVGEDLVLDLATEQVIGRLDGLDPAEAGELLHLLHVVVGDAAVADLALPHQVLEGAGGLLGWRVLVGPVDLVHVDVVRIEVPQARFDAR